MAVSVLCLFLALPWVGLWPVIVVFPGHTHLFMENRVDKLDHSARLSCRIGLSPSVHQEF